MGIGFVVIIYLIAISALSVVLALVLAIITYFLSKRETRKKNILTAILSPFIGLNALFICGLLGTGIVSSIKHVDIGIGDTWYVPLQNDCQLLFIDIPDQAYIEKNGQTIISEVKQLQQIDNYIFGVTTNNKYFSYNTFTNELKEYTAENDLIIQNSSIKLINAIDFYADKREDIVGLSLIPVFVFSLLVSATAIYLLRKLIVRYM